MRGRLGFLSVLGGVAALGLSAGVVRAQGPNTPDKPAAVVNGETVRLSEVEAVLRNQGPTAIPVSENQRRLMQRDALAMLIDDLLLDQFLRQYGPKVDPNAVAQAVAELEAGLKKQGKALADFLRESNLTETQLRINTGKMQQWVGFVKARVGDEQLKKHFQDNREVFDRVMVKASHVVLRMGNGASEQERQTARGQLLALRQEIITGKIAFADAAKKYSQCPSAPEGGDIGYFPRKFMVEEPFARAAFALKVGDVSDVVQTEYGLHLIKVTDRKAGQPADFEKVKDFVRESYMEELRQQVLVQQRKAARISIHLE